MKYTPSFLKATVLAVFLILSVNTYSFAQIFGDDEPPSSQPPIGEGGGEGDPNDVMNTPIDGGISILLAAGIAYGAKKGYDRRKKKANDNIIL